MEQQQWLTMADYEPLIGGRKADFKMWQEWQWMRKLQVNPSGTVI